MYYKLSINIRKIEPFERKIIDEQFVDVGKKRGANLNNSHISILSK